MIIWLVFFFLLQADIVDDLVESVEKHLTEYFVYGKIIFRGEHCFYFSSIMSNGKITWNVFGWCVGRKLCTCIAEISDG